MKVVDFKGQGGTPVDDMLRKVLSEAAENGLRYGLFIGVCGEDEDDYNVMIEASGCNVESGLGLLCLAQTIIAAQTGLGD